MPKPEGATGLPLSEEALRLLAALSEELGVSKTAVLELALREKAKRDLPQPPISHQQSANSSRQ